MYQKKYLILSASPIDGQGIGSLLLSDLVSSLPDFNFELAIIPSIWLGSDALLFKRQVSILRGVASKSKLFQSLRLYIFRRFYLARLTQKISTIANRDKVTSIVVAATSPEIVAAAAQLSDMGHNIRIMIWDAPEYIAANMPLSKRNTARHLANFDKIMLGAKACAVVSNAFKEKYQRQYQLECEIIRHGIALPEPIERVKSSRDIKIVFAGSLYSKVEWNAFVGALTANNWVIEGRRVRIAFIGNFPLTGATRPTEIQCLGQLPFDQTLNTISTMDVGYLPYWFAKSHELVTRTSFPGKMSAYAAAGLAVFHHAPPYSSGASFLATHPFGIVCSSVQPKDIIASLKALIGIMRTSEVRNARKVAFEAELSSKVMAERFESFLKHDKIR